MSGDISKVARRLQKLGLPDKLFDPDYPQQHQDAVIRHAELLARMREMERREPEWCAGLPWAHARKEWEEENAGAEVVLEETAVQGYAPCYLQPLRRFMKLLFCKHNPNTKEHQRAKFQAARKRALEKKSDG